MRYFISLLCIVLFTFSLFFNAAEAKRFGGGRSFGMQRNVSNYSRVQPMQTPRAASPASKWLAPLAGLAAGGLLAYLLMGNGIGAGVLSWLAIGAIALLLFNLIRSRMQPATQSILRNKFSGNQLYEAAPSSTNNYATPNNNYSNQSVISDPENFLRDAKTKFIRLQAAYDKKNINDLREFTTPEVFAEVQLQLQERGDVGNQTDVVTLNAELLNSDNEFGVLLASVRFSGLIREESNQNANLFNEVWHFRKEVNDSSWFVAGVQQDK